LTAALTAAGIEDLDNIETSGGAAGSAVAGREPFPVFPGKAGKKPPADPGTDHAIAKEIMPFKGLPSQFQVARTGNSNAAKREPNQLTGK